MATLLSRGFEDKSRKPMSMKLPSLFDEEYETVDYSSDSDDDSIPQPKSVPIEDIITSVPKRYTDLLGILLPRLQPRPQDKATITVEDQQELSQILLGELAGNFRVLQHQINDPFLSPNDNKELHRLILLKVCSIIEDLYEQFITRLAKINKDISMDGSASYTRLKAELMVLVNKSLDIPLIRRTTIDELRGATCVPLIPSGTRPSAPPTSSFKQVKLRLPRLRLPPGYREEVTSEGQHVIVNDGGVAYRHDNRPGFLSTVSMCSSDKERREEDEGACPLEIPFGISYSVPVLPSQKPSIKTKSDEGPRERGVAVTVEDVEGLKFELSSESSTGKVKLGEYSDEMLRQDLINLAQRNVSVKPTNNEEVDENENSEHLSPLLAATGRGLSDKRVRALNQYTLKLNQESECRHDNGEPPSQSPLPLDSVDRNDENMSEMVPRDLSAVHLGDFSMQGSSAGGMLSYTGQSDQSSHMLTEPDCSGLSDDMQHDDYSISSLHGPSSSSYPHRSEIDSIGGEEHSSVTTDNHTPFPVEEFDKSFTDTLRNDLEEPSTIKDSLPPSVPFHEPQPDTISLRIPNMEVTRVSGHRVCERSPKNSLRLQPFPPFYNELCGELDDLTIEKMDAVLQEGDDIQDIYKELSQTLQKDHLDITKDPFLEPYLQSKVDMSSIYASNSLQRRKTLRVINESLAHHGPPPWEGTSRREWLLHSVQKEPPKHQSPAVPRAYNRQKKATKIQDDQPVSVKDYQRYISSKGSDFLGVVHHMYNSSGSDSEDEERERRKQEQLRKLRLELQEKERKRLELLEKKMAYTVGQWNANTVLMGGLGKTPEDIDEQVADAESIDISDVQAKLQLIWNRLKVPSKDRIDMIIVYSNQAISIHLPQILNLWERSCRAVEKRESTLRDLEDFEKKASSTSRHFSKGTSYARTQEEKTRRTLHYKLDAIEKDVIALAKKLRTFSSTLTYKGLNYLEKMSMDRTEMLYYLHQQQRREILMPSIKYLTES